MPLTGLIGFIIVANPDICAQPLPFKKKKETKHKFLEMLPMRILHPDKFCIPKGPGEKAGAQGRTLAPGEMLLVSQVTSRNTDFRIRTPDFPGEMEGNFWINKTRNAKGVWQREGIKGILPASNTFIFKSSPVLEMSQFHCSTFLRKKTGRKQFLFSGSQIKKRFQLRRTWNEEALITVTNGRGLGGWWFNLVRVLN